MSRGRSTYLDLLNNYPPDLTSTEISKHTFDYKEFERRIRVLVKSAKRQSDRSMVNCSTFSNGVVQLSRLSEQEYPGLILLKFFALDGLMKNENEEKLFKKLLNDILFLYQKLMVSSISNTELNLLHERIQKYMALYKKIIGSLQIMKSRVGLKLTKFHSLLHMDYFIREYGAPLNFFEGHLEEFLKRFVKHLYPRKTRQHSIYLYDLSKRLKEMKSFELCEEDIKCQMQYLQISITSSSTIGNNTRNESNK